MADAAGDGSAAKAPTSAPSRAPPAIGPGGPRVGGSSAPCPAEGCLARRTPLAPRPARSARRRPGPAKMGRGGLNRWGSTKKGKRPAPTGRRRCVARPVRVSRVRSCSGLATVGLCSLPANKPGASRERGRLSSLLPSTTPNNTTRVLCGTLAPGAGAGLQPSEPRGSAWSPGKLFTSPGASSGTTPASPLPFPRPNPAGCRSAHSQTGEAPRRGAANRTLSSPSPSLNRAPPPGD